MGGGGCKWNGSFSFFIYFLTVHFLNNYVSSAYTALNHIQSNYLSSKIALQFPDSLLMDSAAVASLIEKNTGKKVFVLADTSYGRYISCPANLKYRRWWLCHLFFDINVFIPMIISCLIIQKHLRGHLLI